MLPVAEARSGNILPAQTTQAGLEPIGAALKAIADAPPSVEPLDPTRVSTADSSSWGCLQSIVDSICSAIQSLLSCLFCGCFTASKSEATEQSTSQTPAENPQTNSKTEEAVSQTTTLSTIPEEIEHTSSTEMRTFTDPESAPDNVVKSDEKLNQDELDAISINADAASFQIPERETSPDFSSKKSGHPESPVHSDDSGPIAIPVTLNEGDGTKRVHVKKPRPVEEAKSPSAGQEKDGVPLIAAVLVILGLKAGEKLDIQVAREIEDQAQNIRSTAKKTLTLPEIIEKLQAPHKVTKIESVVNLPETFEAMKNQPKILAYIFEDTKPDEGKAAITVVVYNQKENSFYRHSNSTDYSPPFVQKQTGSVTLGTHIVYSLDLGKRADKVNIYQISEKE